MRTKLLSLLMVGMLLVAAAPVVEAGLFADFLALFTPRAPTPTDTTPSEPTGAQGQVGSPGDTGPTGQTGPSAIVITPNDEAQVRRAGLSPANQDLLVAAVTKRNLARAAQERTPRSTHRQTALRESEAELKQATIDTGFQPLAFGGGIETSILETGGAIRGSLDDGKQFEGHVSTSDPNDPGVRGAAGDIGQFGATGSVGSEEFSSGSRVKVALSQEDTSRVQESIRQLDRDRSNFRAKFNEFDDRALGLEKEAERLQHDRDGRNFLSRLGGPSQEEIDALTERAKVERKLAGIAKRNFDETIAKLTPLLEAQIREARNQAVQAALRPDGEPSRPEVTSLAGDQTSPVSIEDQIGSREVLRQQTVRDAEDSLSDEARQALDVFRDAARVTREATEKGAVTDAEFDVIVEIERTFRERAESLLDAELANPNDPLNQLTSDILANAVEQGTLIAEENIAFTTPSRDARIGINKQTPDPSQGTSIDQPSINARSSNTDVARSEHLQEKLAKVDANIATLKDRANDVNAKTSAQTQLQDVDNTGFFDRQIPFATAKHIQVNRRVAVDANGFEFFEVEIQGEKAILRVPTDPKGRLSVAKVDGSSISQLLQKNAFQNLEEEGGFFETNNNLVRSDLSEKRFGALGAKIQNARTEDRQNRQEAESLLVQIDAANKERQALAAQAPANFRDTTAIANLEAADRKKDRQKLILLRSIQTDGSLSETQRAQILGKIQAGDLAGAQDAISKSQSRDKALLQDRLGQLSQATVEQEKQQSLSIRNAQTLSRLQDRATVSRQSLNENVLVRGNGLNTVQQKLIADALLRNDFDAARRVLDKIGLNSEEGRAQSIIVQKINTLETIQQNIDKEKQAGGTAGSQDAPDFAPELPETKLSPEQEANLKAFGEQLTKAAEGFGGTLLKLNTISSIDNRRRQLLLKQETGLLSPEDIAELKRLTELSSGAVNEKDSDELKSAASQVTKDLKKLALEGAQKIKVNEFISRIEDLAVTNPEEAAKLLSQLSDTDIETINKFAELAERLGQVEGPLLEKVRLIEEARAKAAALAAAAPTVAPITTTVASAGKSTTAPAASGFVGALNELRLAETAAAGLGVGGKGPNVAAAQKEVIKTTTALNNFANNVLRPKIEEVSRTQKAAKAALIEALPSGSGNIGSEEEFLKKSPEERLAKIQQNLGRELTSDELAKFATLDEALRKRQDALQDRATLTIQFKELDAKIDKAKENRIAVGKAREKFDASQASRTAAQTTVEGRRKAFDKEAEKLEGILVGALQESRAQVKLSQDAVTAAEAALAKVRENKGTADQIKAATELVKSTKADLAAEQEGSAGAVARELAKQGLNPKILEQLGITKEQQDKIAKDPSKLVIGRVSSDDKTLGTGVSSAVFLVDGKGNIGGDLIGSRLEVTASTEKGKREVTVTSARVIVGNRQVDTLNAKEFDEVTRQLGDASKAPSVANSLINIGQPLHRGLKRTQTVDGSLVLSAGKKNEITIIQGSQGALGGADTTVILTKGGTQKAELFDKAGNLIGRVKTNKDGSEGFVLGKDGKISAVKTENGVPVADTSVQADTVVIPKELNLPTAGERVPTFGNTGIARISDEKGNPVFLKDGEVLGGKINDKGVFEADKTKAEELENAQKAIQAEKDKAAKDPELAKKLALEEKFNAEVVRGERGISDVFSTVRRRTGGSGFLAGRALKKYEEFKGLGQLGSFFIGDEKIQERRDRLIDSFCLFGGVSTCFRSALCDEKLPSDSIAGKDILFSVSPTGEVKSVAWISASKGQAFIDIGDDGLGTALALYKVEYGVRNSINDRLGYNIVFFPSTRVADRTPRNWYIKNRELEPGQNEQFSGTTSLLKNSNTDYDRVCIAFSTGIRNRKGDKVSKQCTKITSFEGPPQKFKNPNETKDSPAQGPLGAGGGLIPTFSGGGSSTSSSGQPALNDGGAI